MAFSKNRRLADLVSSAGEVSSFVDASVTHADLHTSMDLTGKTVTVANASTGDSDTTAANTAFVQQEIAALVDSAPGTLNTLNELAAALGDDASFSTTVTNSIATKLPLAGGTLTGTLIGTELNLNAAGDIHSTVNNSYMGLSGGTETNAGANIILYGQSHGSLANTSVFRSSGTETMRIDSNGQVMISHTSSFAHADADNLAIGDGTNNSGLTIYTGASKESSIIFGNAGTDGNIEAGIKYYHESHGTVANRRNMTFSTGGSMAERMRITSTGKVGIGTTTPNLKLHVEESGADQWIADFKHTHADGYGLRVDLSGTTSSTRYALGVYTGGGTGLFLRNNGIVGIGTTAPSRNLEVQLTATNASMTDANSAVHFGSGSGNANSDGYIQGITLGYKTEGSNAYAKTGIVARGRNDGAARQDLAFLVDTAADGGSVQIADAKLTIDGITGDVKFNGGPVKGMRQAVQYQGATNSTTISANSNATFQSTTITTTGNSKLVVWAHSGQILKLQQNSNPWMRIAVNGTYIGAAHEGHHYWYGISSGTSQRLFLTEFGASGTLAAGTHTVTMVGGTYAADMIFNYQNQSGHMVIMEVGA